jgi:hypothetical protein
MGDPQWCCLEWHTVVWLLTFWRCLHLQGRCKLSWERGKLCRRNGRFRVITVVLLKLQVFCGVTLCIVWVVAEVYFWLLDPWRSFQIPGNTCLPTQGHNLEGFNVVTVVGDIFMFMFLRISGLSGHAFSAIPCDCQLLYGETSGKRILQNHYICSMFVVSPYQLDLLDHNHHTSKCQLQHKETGGINLPFLATDTCWRPEG